MINCHEAAYSPADLDRNDPVSCDGRAVAGIIARIGNASHVALAFRLNIAGVAGWINVMPPIASSNEQDFIDRIVAAPLEDEPRIAYAAWLQQRGDPRGDFIHAQCALHRLESRLAHVDFFEIDPFDQAERSRLWNLTSTLLTEHELTWTAELRKLIGAWNLPSEVESRGFHRGFVETIYVQPDLFAAQANKLFAAAPLLREIRFTGPSQGGFDAGLGRALALRPELAAVETVDLSGRKLDDAAFTAFVCSPHLTRLRRLDLGWNSLGPASVSALLQAPFVSNLTSLDLSKNHIGDDGARLIADSAPSAVESLRLSENGAGPRGGMAIAGSCLGALEWLNLANNPLGDDAVCAIVDSPSLVTLRQLALDVVGLSVDGVCRLAGLPGLARIVYLSMSGNDVGDQGLRALAESAHTRSLLSLELSWTRIGDEGVKALAEARVLDQLLNLGLRNNHITEVGARALAATTRLSKLRELDLAYNKIAGKIPGLEANMGGQFLRVPIESCYAKGQTYCAAASPGRSSPRPMVTRPRIASYLSASSFA